MNSLVFVQNDTVVTDSLTIAQLFGKNHDNVLRDIRTQIEYAGEEFALLNFEECEYTNVSAAGINKNRKYPKINLTEEAFALVVFSYNTKEAVQTKIKFIQEFKRMKEHIQKQERAAEDPIVLALETSLKNYQEIKAIKEDVTFLKDHMRIDGAQEHTLNSKGKAKVLQVLGGYDSAAYNAVARKVFAHLWRDFKNHFQLPRYSELPKTKYEDALYFISKWHPNTSLEIEIESHNKQTHLKLIN